MVKPQLLKIDFSPPRPLKKMGSPTIKLA